MARLLGHALDRGGHGDASVAVGGGALHTVATRLALVWRHALLGEKGRWGGREGWGWGWGGGFGLVLLTRPMPHYGDA